MMSPARSGHSRHRSQPGRVYGTLTRQSRAYEALITASTTTTLRTVLNRSACKQPLASRSPCMKGRSDSRLSRYRTPRIEIACGESGRRGSAVLQPVHRTIFRARPGQRLVEWAGKNRNDVETITCPIRASEAEAHIQAKALQADRPQDCSRTICPIPCSTDGEHRHQYRDRVECITDAAAGELARNRARTAALQMSMTARASFRRRPIETGNPVKKGKRAKNYAGGSRPLRGPGCEGL